MYSNPYFVDPELIMKSFGNSLNTIEGIKKAKMYNKFAPQEEQAKLSDMIARQQNDQAMAKYAPELYGSRAGLASLQLQEQPQSFNAQMAAAGQEAQMRALQQQILKQKMAGIGAYSPKSNFGKAIQDAQSITQIYGKNSPQAQAANAYVKNISQGKQGMTIYDPTTGQPLVNVGGSGGGFGSSGAKTVYNPQTGQYGTIPTTAVAGKMQNALVSDPQLMKTLNDSINLYAPYMGIKGQAKLKTERATNYLGATDFSSPGTYDYLTKVQTPLNAEKLLRIAGINGTSENVGMMRQALEFDPSEGIAGMKDRVMRTLAYLKENKLNNQQFLSPAGIPLNETKSSNSNVLNFTPGKGFE